MPWEGVFFIVYLHHNYSMRCLDVSRETPPLQFKQGKPVKFYVYETIQSC